GDLAWVGVFLVAFPPRPLLWCFLRTCMGGCLCPLNAQLVAQPRSPDAGRPARPSLHVRRLRGRGTSSPSRFRAARAAERRRAAPESNAGPEPEALERGGHEHADHCNRQPEGG